MKKIMIIVALFCALTSCTQYDFEQEYENVSVETRSGYTTEQLEAIAVVYESCLMCFDVPAEMVYENPTVEQKLAVIRYCDLIDESGDVLSEMCEYDIISEILWPNGYGN